GVDARYDGQGKAVEFDATSKRGDTVGKHPEGSREEDYGDQAVHQGIGAFEYWDDRSFEAAAKTRPVSRRGFGAHRGPVLCYAWRVAAQPAHADWIRGGCCSAVHSGRGSS